jgi:hypothetical protein
LDARPWRNDAWQKREADKVDSGTLYFHDETEHVAQGEVREAQRLSI